MTVLQILTEPLKYSGEKTSKKERFEKAAKIIEEVGLSKEDLSRRPQEFSGGQRQRISIARALIMNPKLLICDEPTSALDPELVGEVLNVIKKLANEGVTMLVVTHEIEFASNIANKIVFMDQGKIAEIGTPKEILSNPTNQRLIQFLNIVEPEEKD